jgi:DNA repair exonuclease SbcCD ATPase subunit
MKIKKVYFKNFASYGNTLQVLDFEESSNLFLVLGGNGFGKSTMANVIKFLCYGKVEGVNNGELPNRINKNLWGSIELESRGRHVKIERGLAPNVFKVYINGVEYDQAGKLNTQDYLEQEIFEISYNVFKNVIILSVNDFKSFLTMSPGDKKGIVDKLFGFSAINDMKELIKKDRKEVKQELKTLEDELNSLTESIISFNDKIIQLEEASQKKNAEKIKDLKNQLYQLDENKKKLNEANKTLKDKINVIDKQISENRKIYAESSAEIKSIDQKLKLFENKQCPTCQSDLSGEFHQNLKRELEDKKSQHKEKEKSAEDLIKESRESYKSIQDKQHGIISKLSSLETNMNSLKKELVKLASNLDNGEHTEFSSLINEFREKEREKIEKKTQVGSDDHYLQILETILGEDGIKNLAVKTILPTFNSQVAQMGRRMHIPFNIKFDEKFDSIITHLGEDINPKTMSTGERKKADFVIIIALIRLLKLRYPSLNILFLDEIFSSVDSDGVYHIINILHDMVKEIEMNTFVINHTVLPSELFDKKIEIRKDSGFSTFSVETIS